MHLPLGKNKEMSSNSISIRKSTLGISIDTTFPANAVAAQSNQCNYTHREVYGKGGSTSVCVRYIIPHESTC